MNMSHVTICLAPCRMSLSPMSDVHFKKCPCRASILGVLRRDGEEKWGGGEGGVSRDCCTYSPMLERIELDLHE